MNEILKKFDSFAKSLSSRDRVAVLTDYDADGLCAGALVCKAVEKLSGKKPALTMIALRQKQPIDEKTLKALKKARVNKLIASDISLEAPGRKEIIEKIAEFAEVLVIDHHKVYGKFKSKQVLLVKPQFFSKIESSNYPASKMVFDLFSRVTDLKGSEWLAAAGLYGDFAEKQWKKFFNNAVKKAGVKRKRIIEISYILTAVKTFNHKMLNDCLKELIEGKPKTVLGKFKKFETRFNKALESEEKKFWEKAGFFPELAYFFYFAESKLDTASPLINRVSSKKPDSTIIIAHKNPNGVIGLHARRQDKKIAVNDLLEKAVKGLKGASAGGHVPAAGGKIKAKDLELFRKRVLSILKSGKKC